MIMFLKKNVNFNKIYKLLDNLYLFKKSQHKSPNLLEELDIFLRICCQKDPSKSPLYEKVKMITKFPFVIESFVTIGSFDCDCILMF
jgi:hypothetical protein